MINLMPECIIYCYKEPLCEGFLHMAAQVALESTLRHPELEQHLLEEIL